MPVAWYNRATNTSSLISATSNGVHASTSPGPTLGILTRKDCGRLVFNSTFDLDPATYANHQWLCVDASLGQPERHPFAPCAIHDARNASSPVVR